MILKLINDCQDILKEHSNDKIKSKLDNIDIELFDLSTILNDEKIDDKEKIEIIKKRIWEE